MERFNALSRGLQVMLIGSLLLLIDSFLDWQQVSGNVFGQEVSAGRSGWHGVGVIMGILTIVLIAWLIVRLAAAHITLPVSDAMTGALLGFLILLFTVVTFFVNNEFRHWPAWVGLILAIVIAVGAWLAVQEAGGVESLKTEATTMSSSMGSRSDTTTSAPPPPATEPPAAPPPAAPPAPSEPMTPPPSSAPPPPPDVDPGGGGEDRPA
jgi:hypothetical protein